MVGEGWARERSQRRLESQMNQGWLNYKIKNEKGDHDSYSKHIQAGRVGIDSDMRDDPREEILREMDICGGQKPERCLRAMTL